MKTGPVATPSSVQDARRYTLRGLARVVLVAMALGALGGIWLSTWKRTPSHAVESASAPFNAAAHVPMAANPSLRAPRENLPPAMSTNRADVAAVMPAPGGTGQAAPAKALRVLGGSEQASLWKAFGEARRAVTALTPREAAMPHNAGVTHFAQNPGQDLTLRFQSGSVRIGSGRSGSAWEVTLRIEGAGHPAATVQGTRVEYAHGAQVTEWWENRAEGIEHGFTLGAGHGLLRTQDGVIVPVVVTGLRVEEADGGLRFVDDDGRAILAYGGLKAMDARGQELAATMRPTDTGLRLAVNDRDTVYPVTIDPLITTLEQKLGPEVTGDGASSDLLGFSVALHGETAVLGAQGDDAALGANVGSVYVFVRTGTNWSRQAKLEVEDGAAEDRLGWSVALDADTALFGTRRGDFSQGIAYVFTRIGSNWSQQAELENEGGVGDTLGASVALDGDTALVGAYLDDTTAGTDAGSASVFVRNGTNWSKQATLRAADGAGGDSFGYAVALDGDMALIGAYHDDLEGAGDVGSAYVFVRSGTNWSHQAKLVAGDGTYEDNFGKSVALNGDTALVGAHYHEADVGPYTGSAYVFVREGTNWSQQARLEAADRSAYDWFGFSVALDGGTALVGAERDDTTAGTDVGSAYIFVRDGTNWSQRAKLEAGAGRDSDVFGDSVALDGDTALIGAAWDDTLAGSDAGSAHVFVRIGTNWSHHAKLDAGDGAVDDRFGFSVALDGNTALVGVVFDDTAAGSSAGSAYVLIRDGTNWSQQARLLAEDGSAGDNLGCAVALAGDVALVGARFDDTFAGSNAGSAYVFIRNGSNWSQQAKLLAENGAADDMFGYTVALDGDTALVGAHYHDTSSGTDAGSGYVFVRDGTNWNQQANLEANDAEAGDLFGYSVALCGDTALLGARFDDAAGGTNFGSAYVFQRTGVSWDQEAKLETADGAVADEVGLAVALVGDIALVSAFRDDLGSRLDAGSVYVFARDGAHWMQEAKLCATDHAMGDQFGTSLAFDGNRALVGAGWDNTSAGADAGSAYVFVRTGTNWSQRAKLEAGDGAVGDLFGFSVALDGDTALVGAQSDDSEIGAACGSVYVFRLQPVPEIVVENAAGIEIVDGGVRVFGGALVGASTNLNFTIRNTGLADLTGLGITVDGADAEIFTVTVDPTAPVPPSGSTAFAVQFAPTNPGDKAAALHIASNDPDEDPYDIDLTGRGLTALEAWRQQHFGGYHDTGDAANGADPERDGIPNLIEFGFGCHPLEISSGQLPECVFDGNHLGMTFTEPAGVDGITYGAEYSTDLNDWFPVTDAGSGTEHVFSISTGSNARMFLRLIVTEE